MNESSPSAANLYIPVRISERSYLHCHPFHNAINCIHGNNEVYHLNRSSVHVRTSSRWDVRDATTPSPIPVRITPCHYIGHMLKNKATRNNQNRNLVVIPRAPLVPKFKPCKAIEVCLLNARSIKNKTTVLNDFVIESKIDVMAFTETWLLPGDVDQAVKSDRTARGYVFRGVSRENVVEVLECCARSLFLQRSILQSVSKNLNT